MSDIKQINGMSVKDATARQQITDLASKVVADGAGAHNAIFRGKALGNSITSAQWTAIQNGTFADLFIGDYWTIDGVNWRIAHFDYWLRCGDTECTKHHAVIVPDSNLYNAQMNTTNVTTGGYLGSAMHESNLAQAKSKISGVFGSHVLNIRRLFTNAVTNGKPSAGTWADSTVDLMDECMVYGSRIMSPANDGSTIPYNYTTDYKQLRLFALAPQFICNRAWYWLLNVVSGTFFAGVYGSGSASFGSASASNGVRPAFAIG